MFSKNNLSPRSKALDSVNEEEEFLLIDKKGNAYDLNKDQLSYLKSLSQSNPSSHGHPAKEEPLAATMKMPEEQDIDEAQVPVDIDFQVLQNMNPVELNRILEENKMSIIAGDNKNKRLLTNKKMF